MNASFERSGPIEDIHSYPTWAQDIVAGGAPARQAVMDHEIFAMMREARLDATSTSAFMRGVWPVIERFPGYMALNLLKTRFGRSAGDNLARRWLVRNIRVEQNHAEYWLDWAEGSGVSREDVTHGWVAPDLTVLAQWCEEVSRDDTLAAGVAATNYAVEGATGDWSQIVYESTAYSDSFSPEVRARSMKWLKLHAAYDDTHPWEALEIVCTLLGMAPPVHEVKHIGECINRSYRSMTMTLDRCLDQRRMISTGAVVAA